MTYDERHVRPGGTLSGPSMMGLADLALYVAILAQIGPVALAESRDQLTHPVVHALRVDAVEDA